MNASHHEKGLPIMFRIILCLLALLLHSAVSCYAQMIPAPVTTFILTRHAEKAITPASDDPELSADGLKRAEKLASLLQSVPLAAVYATPYKRTTNTALPLAKAQGLPIQAYSAKTSAAQMDTLLHKHAGATILVVGHSNTVPQMLNALTGSEKYPALDDRDYDNIFIVSLTRLGNANVTRLSLKM